MQLVLTDYFHPTASLLCFSHVEDPPTNRLNSWFVLELRGRVCSDDGLENAVVSSHRENQIFMLVGAEQWWSLWSSSSWLPHAELKVDEHDDESDLWRLFCFRFAEEEMSERQNQEVSPQKPRGSNSKVNTDTTTNTTNTAVVTAKLWKQQPRTSLIVSD